MNSELAEVPHRIAAKCRGHCNPRLQDRLNRVDTYLAYSNSALEHWRMDELFRFIHWIRKKRWVGGFLSPRLALSRRERTLSVSHSSHVERLGPGMFFNWIRSNAVVGEMDGVRLFSPCFRQLSFPSQNSTSARMLQCSTRRSEEESSSQRSIVL